MTGSIRLFVETPLADGAEVPATPEQAHYLGHVMRQPAGAEVALFNGADGEFQAEIAAIRRDRAQFVVTRRLRPQEAGPDLTLVFAPLKRDATNLVIEKATELGVSRIRPVFTERTNTGRLNLERLAAIAREAAEQSERLTLPVIEEPVRLFDLLGTWPNDRVLSAAIERSGAARPRAMVGPTGGPAALLIGPEGGFSPPELDALRRCPFVERIGLGPLILRAETAAIVGLALLQAGSTG